MPEQPIRVRIANGTKLQGKFEYTNYKWSCQGHGFHTTFKVIPLQYDLVLGMGRLKASSTMTVDWEAKIMSFSSGNHILLYREFNIILIISTLSVRKIIGTRTGRGNF